MSVDPFASAPADADPWGPEADVVAPATSVRTGQAPDGKFVITLKGGSGFDAPWFVGHLDSLQDVDDLLNRDAEQLSRVLTRLQVIAPVFAAASQSVGGPSSAPRRPAPAAAQEPPANAPAAPGPDWTYRSGVGKSNGKAWQAWMPPRGSNDKPVFFD